MFNLDKFLSTLHGITPLRIRNVSRIIGWDEGKPPGGTVSPGHAMFIWLADFLQTFDHMSHDQVDSVLMAFRKQIKDYGDNLQENINGNHSLLPVQELVIADRKYCTISGANDFLDLRTGGKVDGLPRAPAMVMHYNMCEIYSRQRLRVEKLHKPKPETTPAQ